MHIWCRGEPQNSGTITFRNDQSKPPRWQCKFKSWCSLTGTSANTIIYIIPRSSYYDKNYRQTAALIRARRPYLVKNALTGLGIFGFCVGVCKYSNYFKGISWLTGTNIDFFTINAVAQDEFEDVKVPDAPVQSPRAGASTMTNGPVMK